MQLPMPPLERVTSLIARKLSLYDRKRHECHLRSLAQKTASQFGALQPAGFVVGAIPPMPAKYVAPDPSERQNAKGQTQSTLGN